MILFTQKEDTTKVQANKNMFYFEIINKNNVDALGITVSMCRWYDFETIFTSNNVTNVQGAIGKGFGY